MFRRVSVFAGGCDLDAFAAVAAGRRQRPGAGPDPLELVAELHDVSLITVTEGADGEPRVGMLETIREYALERLEPRPATWTAPGAGTPSTTPAFAEQAHEQLDGPAHLAVMDRLEAEHDNLRAALDLVAGRARPRAAAANGPRQACGWCRRWPGSGISTATPPKGGGGCSGRSSWPPTMQGRRWPGWRTGSASCWTQQGELDAALRVFERSLAIWRELGDRDQQARELNSLGITHRHLGDLDTARSLLEESIAIAREIGRRLPARRRASQPGPGGKRRGQL